MNWFSGLKVWQKVLIGFAALALVGQGLKLAGFEPPKKQAAARSPGEVAAVFAASEMKSGGKIRPRGDELDALARATANQMNVRDDQRKRFVSDFVRAFNIVWDKMD
jgi:hypothetical protein